MRKNNVFGLTSLIILKIMTCLFVLPFFISMLREQIEIGKGTLLDMGALAVWMVEAILLIPFLISVVFTIISAVQNDYKAKIIANIVLISVCVVLTILANLWIVL